MEWIRFVLPWIGPLFGAIIALCAVIWIQRKMAPLQGQALKDLVRTQELHVNELKTERDDYRTKLHDTRNKLQASELRIKELELRPDLSSLSSLLENQNTVMHEISSNLSSHILSDQKVFTEIEKTLKRIAAQLPRK